MTETVLSGIVPTALPMPVWICFNNATTHRRPTDYLIEVEAVLMIARPF